MSWGDSDSSYFDMRIEEAERLAVENEREACAKLAEDMKAPEIARAIRERSTKP